MIKTTRRKTILFYFVAISFMLFFSFLLSDYAFIRQNSDQIYAPLDSINIEQLQIKINTDSVINLKKNNNSPNLDKSMPNKGMISNSSLPDFSSYKNVNRKKRKFFDFLKPHIQKENKLILEQRQFIKDQHNLFMAKDTLYLINVALLENYILDYRCVNTDLTKNETFKELLIRVDIIPQELALVQAALESSWGSSYFARNANNLFGQWCFEPGCGIIPRKRKKGETHEVAKFETIDLSIRSYMLFLNSHPAFDLLRSERSANRVNNEKPSALLMANGLTKYSAREKAYIREVKSMIRSNNNILISRDKNDNIPDISLQNQDGIKSGN